MNIREGEKIVARAFVVAVVAMTPAILNTPTVNAENILTSAPKQPKEELPVKGEKVDFVAKLPEDDLPTYLELIEVPELLKVPGYRPNAREPKRVFNASWHPAVPLSARALKHWR